MKEVLFGHEVSTQMDFSRIRGTGLVRFPYLLVLLAALVLADGLITEFLVAGGLGREGNPLLRGIVDNGSLMQFKTAGVLVSTLILWDLCKRHPDLAFTSTLLLVGAYTGIVYWNIFSFVVTAAL